jgi:hypothetical protein
MQSNTPAENRIFPFARRWLVLFPLSCIFLLFTSACKRTAPTKQVFIHDLNSGPRPWTSEEFESTEEDFTFAIISDLNGGERPGVFSRAVAQLNQLEPTFVLSVGDLIDGGTTDSLQLQMEWDFFDARAAKLDMPFFHLGGNHDLTNTRMREFWKNRFGPRYYHFLYQDVLFLMLDSEDYSEQRMEEIYQARDSAIRILDGKLEGAWEESTYYHMPERNLGGIGDAQMAYFKGVLQAHPDVRWTFLLMHKPLWLREDGMGLSRETAPFEELESELEGRNYSVINGHFHRMSHRKRKGMDYLILATTGGSQAPGDSTAFDHVTLVRMARQPVITHLKMDGILRMDASLPPLEDPELKKP